VIVPFRSKYTPIGLDIGACAVKAVQLQSIGRRWHLAAMTNLPRPQINAPLDRAGVRRIADVLYRQGFYGHSVILAAPNDKLAADILELPPRSAGVPLEQIARSEMARIIGAPIGGFEMAFWDLPTQTRTSSGTSVLALGLRHTDADPLLELFDFEGLSVDAIDSQSCALARACQTQINSVTGITTILDMGWNAALLVLIHEGVVVYRRPLNESGIHALHKTIASKLGLSDHIIQLALHPLDNTDSTPPLAPDLWNGIRTLAGKHMEHLVSELLASFVYAAHRYPDAHAQQLLLVGGGATLPDAQGYLQRYLDVDVKTITLADLVECPPFLVEKCQSPSLITALGLAQHESR
jgi:Tfp pilus assembly PilM family ATPase